MEGLQTVDKKRDSGTAGPVIEHQRIILRRKGAQGLFIWPLGSSQSRICSRPRFFKIFSSRFLMCDSQHLINILTQVRHYYKRLIRPSHPVLSSFILYSRSSVGKGLNVKNKTSRRKKCWRSRFWIFKILGAWRLTYDEEDVRAVDR